MSELVNKLKVEFRDKETRQVYVDEFLNSSIATQIKVLREQRGWNQERLAQETDMKQSRISVLEDVNYSSWSIKTLRRLAEAFDLTLCVSLEEFGTRLGEIVEFSRESLQRRSFSEDPVFNKQDEGAVEMCVESVLQEQAQVRRPQGDLVDIKDFASKRETNALTYSRLTSKKGSIHDKEFANLIPCMYRTDKTNAISALA